MWDADAIYLLMDVQEPTPMTNRTTVGNIWNGDAVELFFSIAANDDRGVMKKGDYQLGLSAGCPEAKVPPSVWNWTDAVAVEGATIAVRRNTGKVKGYVLEARIPIASISGFRPKPELLIDFDLGMDNGGDKNLGQRNVQLMWNGLEDNNYNRENWGRATLLP